MDLMDPNREALHLHRSVGVGSTAVAVVGWCGLITGASGVGHVTRLSLASLDGRSFGRDGLDGLMDPNREALLVQLAGGVGSPAYAAFNAACSIPAPGATL